jgi:hypothetical protein
VYAPLAGVARRLARAEGHDQRAETSQTPTRIMKTAEERYFQQGEEDETLHLLYLANAIQEQCPTPWIPVTLKGKSMLDSAIQRGFEPDMEVIDYMVKVMRAHNQ